MYKLIRPLLFKASSDPETMHRIVMGLLSIMGNTAPLLWAEKQVFGFENQKLEQNVFGLMFKNPVGLGAGFDKHAEAVKGLIGLGFGHLELGTVTKLAQPGNPRQRIFRLPKDEALINRMGFNNEGADALSRHLSSMVLGQGRLPLGISLGKSKATELHNATEDYLYSFSRLYNVGDYFVVNISSPNTPGLRLLQDKKFLVDILSAINSYRSRQAVRKPVLVKIVVDFTLEAIDEILEVCNTESIDGIIVSNTTLSREGLKTSTNEAGGLSGAPLRKKSTQLIHHIYERVQNLPIIGVGGIFTSEHAYEKIKAGASLVQVYTGLIYEGPGLVKKINKGLVTLLERDGFKSISDAVGADIK